MARAATRFVVAATLVSSLACGGAPRGVVDKCTDQLSLPPSVTTDFLFVIDNSISMGDDQAKVVARLSAFVDVLSNAPVKNDFQIGVITTSVSVNYLDACPPAGSTQFYAYTSQAGRLQLGTDLAGVTQPASKRTLLSYQDPDLLEQFGLLIGQGVVGSGQEMPYEAMRRALSSPRIPRPARLTEPRIPRESGGRHPRSYPRTPARTAKSCNELVRPRCCRASTSRISSRTTTL